MRPRQGSWRSARHVVPPPQTAVVDATPGQLRTPAPATRAPRGRFRSAVAATGDSLITSFLKGTTQYPATWSVSFVGVLVYIFSAVTYRLPLVIPGMVLALLGLLMERRVTVPFFVILFAAYVAWAAASYTSSVDPAGTLAETIVLAKVFVICFVIANVTRDGWRMRLFMVFFLACFALYPVRGTFVNFFIVRYTLFGRALWNYIYSNSNDLAALTYFPLSLAVAVVLTETNKWVKRGALAGVVVLPLMILLTQSRGALIALVATGMLFFVVHTKGRRVRSLLMAAAAAIVVLPLVPQSAWQRFSRMKNLASGNTKEADPEGSADARYNIWRVAGTIILENPVSGIGLGVYPRGHAMYAPRVGVPDAALGFRDTHSTYLNVAAETGIPGVFLFLSMIGVVAVTSERTRRLARGTPRADQLLALEFGLLAFMLAGVFGSFAKLSFLYIQLAIMWALSDITKREIAAGLAQPMRSTRPQGRRSQRLIAR
jgi:putative inorganic carbon (HCO3(-)) transporter